MKHQAIAHLCFFCFFVGTITNSGYVRTYLPRSRPITSGGNVPSTSCASAVPAATQYLRCRRWQSVKPATSQIEPLRLPLARKPGRKMTHSFLGADQLVHFWWRRHQTQRGKGCCFKTRKRRYPFLLEQKVVSKASNKELRVCVCVCV